MDGGIGIFTHGCLSAFLSCPRLIFVRTAWMCLCACECVRTCGQCICLYAHVCLSAAVFGSQVRLSSRAVPQTTGGYLLRSHFYLSYPSACCNTCVGGWVYEREREFMWLTHLWEHPQKNGFSKIPATNNSIMEIITLCFCMCSVCVCSVCLNLVVYVCMAEVEWERNKSSPNFPVFVYVCTCLDAYIQKLPL